MDDFISVLTIIEKILICITSLYTMSFIMNYRRQRSAATFGYWAQMLAFLVPILQEYEKLGKLYNERLLPISERHEEPSPITILANTQRKHFSQKCIEMLKFLREAKEQVPASEKWLLDIKSLIAFLNDMASIENDSFYKFVKRDVTELDTYYKDNLKIMKNITDEIVDEQDRIISNNLFERLMSNQSKSKTGGN